MNENPGRNLMPSSATSYLLTILNPNHKDQLTMRTAREFRTVAKILDLLAQGLPERAADICAQRFKALELSLTDQGWARAQHVELIPAEGATLVDKDEALMATREQVSEVKMKQAFALSPWRQRGKAYPRGEEKGKGKGKSKGKKGKTFPRRWEGAPKEGDKSPAA